MFANQLISGSDDLAWRFIIGGVLIINLMSNSSGGVSAVVPELGGFVVPIVGDATLLRCDDAATFHALRACRRGPM